MKKSILTILILAFVLTACTGRKTDITELRFGFTAEPSSLDPLNPENTADGRSILFNVFEGLVKPGTDGKMLPGIAETWTIDQSNLVYNFTLRENIYFHDGSLVTSADVLFSLETAAAAGFFGLENISRLDIDGMNITISLKTPDPEFLPYLTVGIVPAANNDRDKNIIGTGPFFIESYTPQRELVLKKFDNYRQSNIPFFNKVTVVFFANNDSLMIALRGGSIDGARITGSMAAQLDPKNFDIFHTYSAAVQLLALNNAAPPLDDIHIRRALNFGIDVQNIIDTAFFGMGSPSQSPVIPGLAAYYENSTIYSYDPEKAKELLAYSGYNNENKLSLEITVPSNYAMHVDTAQVIVNQLEQIGVNAGIKQVDWNTWINDIYLGRQYEATIISLDSPSVSAKSFLSRYYTGDSGNFINFSSAEFDRIYNSILLETNEELRIQLYKQAQRAIVENAASLFLQDIYYIHALRGGLYGGVLNYPLYVTDFASIYGIENN